MNALSEWSGDSEGWSQYKKLASLDPAFRAKVQLVIDALRQHGWKPHVVFGWRSIEKQRELKAAGRSTVDFGYHNNVNDAGHPAALAVDLIDSRYGWGDEDDPNSGRSRKAMEFFRALGATAKAHGLYWGGDWITFKDYAHVQALPNSALGSVKAAALAVWDRLFDVGTPQAGPNPPSGSGGVVQAAKRAGSTAAIVLMVLGGGLVSYVLTRK